MEHQIFGTSQEGPQIRFDFDKEGAMVIGALCFDGKRGDGKKIFRCDLTSVGDGTYIDKEGARYGRSLSRDVDGPGPRFTRMAEN